MNNVQDFVNFNLNSVANAAMPMHAASTTTTTTNQTNPRSSSSSDSSNNSNSGFQNVKTLALKFIHLDVHLTDSLFFSFYPFFVPLFYV
jgi:hypothetical protein